MFSWKRQRKEEPEDEAELRSAAAAGPGGDDDVAVGDCSEPATPTAAGPGLASLCPATSIELAAMDCAAGAAGSPGAPAPALERASVRSKAAFFEALIHSNTTAHVVCTAEGTQQLSYPAGAAGGVAAAALPACSSSGGGGGACAAHDGSAGEARYSEVRIQLRLPHPAAPGGAGSGRYGSVAEMEALIDSLQAQLVVSERQRRAAANAYARREGECENLRRVVRELSESRAKAATQRASLSERYGELQQEYHRMLRIADLSRTVSKENVASASRTRSELRRVQLELHATRSHAHSLGETARKARVEAALLREKVTLLERLDLEEALESEVKRQYTGRGSRLVETY